MRIIRLATAACLALPLAFATSACETEEPAVEEVAPAEEEAPRVERAPELPEVEQLTPLGSDDVGRRVEIEGTVVGEPLDEGFWVANDEGTVVFVRSDRPAPTGAETEDMDYQGELRAADAQQMTGWMEQANLEGEPGYADWDVQHEVYLDLMVASPAAAPMDGAQGPPQP